MNLNDAYRFINFIANKELSGKTMQPLEYNVNLEAAQLDFYNRELQKVRAYAAKDKLTIFQVIEIGHSLRPFIRPFTLSVIPTNGKIAVPPLFVDAKSAKCKVATFPKPVTFVSDEHLNFRTTNPLEVSPLDMPIASLRGQYIQVWPKSMTDLEIIYLKLPEKPYYAYTLDANTDLPTYNPAVEVRSNSLGTGSGSATVGQACTVTATLAPAATTVQLGSYVAEGTETLLQVLHGVVANINQRSTGHGWTAEVASATTIKVYAPIGSGVAADAYTIASTTTGVTISFAALTSTGVAGSRQLEFDPVYHLEIIKIILSNIGVNLSEERLAGYQKAYEVQGV